MKLWLWPRNLKPLCWKLIPPLILVCGLEKGRPLVVESRRCKKSREPAPCEGRASATGVRACVPPVLCSEPERWWPAGRRHAQLCVCVRVCACATRTIGRSCCAIEPQPVDWAHYRAAIGAQIAPAHGRLAWNRNRWLVGVARELQPASRTGGQRSGHGSWRCARSPCASRPASERASERLGRAKLLVRANGHSQPIGLAPTHPSDTCCQPRAD